MKMSIIFLFNSSMIFQIISANDTFHKMGQCMTFPVKSTIFLSVSWKNDYITLPVKSITFLFIGLKKFPVRLTNVIACQINETFLLDGLMTFPVTEMD